MIGSNLLLQHKELSSGLKSSKEDMIDLEPRISGGRRQRGLALWHRLPISKYFHRFRPWYIIEVTAEDDSRTIRQLSMEMLCLGLPPLLVLVIQVNTDEGEFPG